MSKDTGVVRLAKYLFDSNDLAWMLPLPPWAAPEYRALRRLRKVARGKLRAEVIEWFGVFRLITQTIAWPAISTLKAAIELKGHQGTPTAKLRQFWAYCWIQWAHNIRISDQNGIKLTIPHRRKHLLGYMQWRENQALINLTKERFQGYPDVHNKRSFARFCLEYDLPAPPLLAEGERATFHITAKWPKADLIFKPSDLGWGQGIEVLRYNDATSQWLGQDEVIVTPQNIAAYARQQIGDEPWVLQPRIRNADSWDSITDIGLSTVRVVTGRTGKGSPPVIIAAYLKIPGKGQIVDNISGGGLGIPLDPHTGSLDMDHATFNLCEKPPEKYRDYRPFNDGILPGYQKISSLALLGHQKAGDWITLGWDIALTNEGAQLIETNLNWAMMQFSPGPNPTYLNVMQSALEVD